VKLTVDQLLQLVNDRFLQEPDDFGRKATLRRLAQLRGNYGRWGAMLVDIPKPAMSPQAQELLGNSPTASSAPSSPEPKAEAPEPAVVTVKKKSTRTRRTTTTKSAAD
jgi:hypothetical protein